MKPILERKIRREGQSYFVPTNEQIYDHTRNNKLEIKLFGFTIYKKTDVIENSEIINIKNAKIGFKRDAQ